MKFIVLSFANHKFRNFFQFFVSTIILQGGFLSTS